MTFTCDRCQGEYQPSAANAVARMYVKDSRCNHIEARCTQCQRVEITYLGPERFAAALRGGTVPITVFAEATGDLRVRAETAWAAAEREAARAEEQPPTPLVPAPAEDRGDTLQRYELTMRHERLLTTFGETLENIPDELLWDGLEGEHHREYPDRWID